MPNLLLLENKKIFEEAKITNSDDSWYTIENPMYAMNLNMLGSLYVYLERYADAENIFSESQEKFGRKSSLMTLIIAGNG